MTLPTRLKFGIFMAPFHRSDENPTLALQRNIELIQRLDQLGYDEAWIGEHHSGGWEIIASPELFITAVAERTKYIKLGTGVLSLPYHHPLMVANRMVLLDHLTRGRAMLGVGPGALVSDAYMLGIEPTKQRRRMEEALEIILRLWTEREPFSYESDWFTLKEARAHLRPYTKPHMPVAVAAQQSPAGMVLAGKFGTMVLTFNPIYEGTPRDLKKFWQIAEDSASKHNNYVDRYEWRLALHVHLAESRKEAIEQIREGAGRYQKEYNEDVLGFSRAYDGPPENIAEHMAKTGDWCIGTPSDLIDYISRMDESSGGFGGLLIQAVDWASREDIFHSFELLARYVMPHFQDSIASLKASETWVAEKKDEFNAMITRALQKARSDYTQGSRED